MGLAASRRGSSVARVVIRGSERQLRLASSFTASGLIHGLLIGWLVMASAIEPESRPQTIYDQEIRPYESHLVWYNLGRKLSDVRPAAKRDDRRPPRAHTRSSQSIVAGKEDNARPPQFIAMPAPAIELPKALALPNALAVAAPKPVRRFFPPPVARSAGSPATVLPEAPLLQLSKTNPIALATPAERPTRQFAAPPEVPAKKVLPGPAALPEAPLLQLAKTNPIAMATPGERPTRQFAAPPEVRPKSTPPPPSTLPEAPLLELSKTNPIAMAVPAERPTRAFAPPPEARPKSTPPPPAALPEAPPAPRPAVPGASRSLPVEAPALTPIRSFSPPTAPEKSAPPPVIVQAPPLPVTSPTPDTTRTLAIAGLHPVDTPDLPIPPGSHAAGFSAGPKPSPADGAAANESAAVTVPGLLTRSGSPEARSAVLSALAAPTSEQRLLAALHASRAAGPAPAEPGSASGASRMAGAPDEGRLAGRYVYMIAISMPNVTSYSGSWVVWFAERRPEPGEPPRVMTPPVAVRKVDPKYVRSAAEERVEGVVRLAAVIRKTGAVDSVELLHHLDGRLDQSAKEALSKWEFKPALRDGRPIDVDAIFEIPFRVAPLPKR